MTLSGPAAAARAQAPGPIAFDPNAANLGTGLVVGLDGSLLSAGSGAPTAITYALPRGMHLDTASRERLCTRDQATRGTCPTESAIGFGRYVMTVRDYLPSGGGVTDLTWWLSAYLAKPASRGDAASVALTATLLGADSVVALLEPAIGTKVPVAVTSSGRFVRRSSGTYGLELRFPGLPTTLQPAAPATATPSRLELSLSAVRRTRQNFLRRFKVRTPSGWEVRKVRDHRLVGHDLLRTPRSCSGSWPYELRVGFADGVRRTPGHAACTAALI